MSALVETELRVDSIQLKHRIQRDIAEETRGMSQAERLNYYLSLSQKWHADRKMTGIERRSQGT